MQPERPGRLSPTASWVGVAWKGTMVIPSPWKLEIGLELWVQTGVPGPPGAESALSLEVPWKGWRENGWSSLLALAVFPLLQGDPGFLALWIVLGLVWPPAWESLYPNLD